MGCGLVVPGCQNGGELFARGDLELLVSVGEVAFDGSRGDEQVLRDVAVREPSGGRLSDATLARCQRVEPAEDEPSGSPPGGDEFGASIGREVS